ncbi:MAG: SDR family NAD(P)-dependent oxidoreductase, partial [Bacteroidota bacterium]
MQKTILITGSTDGIGKLTAILLAQAGHEVHIHGRNAEKLAKVRAEIEQQTGQTLPEGFVADFSDLDAVREIVADVRKLAAENGREVS